MSRSSTGTLTRVCVFCGSKTGGDPAYAEAATAFGRLLGERGIGLVYGGGGSGLMGAVATATKDAGGRVVGVIPHSMVDAERAFEGCDELIPVNTMHERKQAMHERADAFVALPGGTGTFEELFEAMAWDQLDLHDKPIGLLDVGGFYQPLWAFVRGAHLAGFVPRSTVEHVVIGTDPQALLGALDARALAASLGQRPPRLGLDWSPRA